MPRIAGGAGRAFAFYGIALGLAVAVALSAPVTGAATPLLTMFTPALAVAIMLGFLAPEGGFRAALAGLGLGRAGLRAWPVAIAVPALIFGVGLGVMALAGLTAVAIPVARASFGLVLLKVATGLAAQTLFSLAEEVGWRGYMLPRMGGFRVLPAMLLVGFLHGVWHLPLMLATDFYHPGGDARLVVPMFLLTLTLAGVFYGFLRLWTGSVWPVALAHAATNTAWDMTGKLSQARSALAVEYVGGESGLLVIGGLIVVALVIRRAMPRFGSGF
ncbi:MAG TPA: CPBP family intramembrane metalloprotease [Amaricoccus sp.]|uniref:CPBP family intramembrane glutamic endopeptidase n=1 Tax=Amaricoccus sp. TaxID=1872485 RepID=UPI002C6CE080|nr:CPBP family intramembrane glutamic endopeptidase [Amaricoccus sp.]HMQ92597.1 CPBP family intramembrane metalloprotease [Amaricoccus sp.]HMR59851.1 CPBP family intramembrane metalloprotease [Amaricoccus sp.]HMT99435.1 CPBP family intramembrane metalloprotease [Amaricoccus sp.]